MEPRPTTALAAGDFRRTAAVSLASIVQPGDTCQLLSQWRGREGEERVGEIEMSKKERVIERGGKGEREREGKGEREKHTDRQTYREKQTDRQTETESAIV